MIEITDCAVTTWFFGTCMFGHQLLMCQDCAPDVLFFFSLLLCAQTDTFPYRTGLVTVVISWFASPVCACIVSAVLFILNRTLVLRRKNSTVRVPCATSVLLKLTRVTYWTF